MWFHEATLLFTAHSVPAQNWSGPMCELSEGGMGGVTVHAKHVIRSCGGTTGSQRGTTLVQPLEVCNFNSKTQDTLYQSIVFRSSNLFYIEIVRFRTRVPIQNVIYSIPLQALEVCTGIFRTPCIYVYQVVQLSRRLATG